MRRAKLSEFRAANDAVAGIEFCGVMPVLFLLVTGAYELSREVNTSRRLTTLASSAATMIASDANGSISYTDLHYAFDSAMVTFPGVLKDAFAKKVTWSKDITISLAGVSFTPTQTGCKLLCTYKANVVWTGGAAQRVCGSTLTAVNDSATPSPTTLPTDLFTASMSSTGGYNPPPFAIVVDVTYSWRPVIFSRFFGAITLSRSAYVSPRYASQVNYAKVTGDDGFGVQCPGY